MIVIEPKQEFKPDWAYGDVLKFENRMFLISGRNALKPFLIEIASGETWYRDARENLDALKSLVLEERENVVHYSKAQYRMYMEAP